LYLLPLVSLIGGAAILDEPITGTEICGGGLILLSVFLSQR
jgi:drug/metabolite transporter (DMT)-like permease